MKIKTGLYAFADGIIRIVDVPDAEWESAKSMDDRLELVYKYGQNDFQPQGIPSLSAGDVIEYGFEVWMILGSGFRKMTIPELFSYSLTPREDRWKKVA